MGISCKGKTAQLLVKSDYKDYDYIIGMEESNIKNIKRIIGEDVDNKISKLLDYSNNPRDIADPWYTDNFDETFDDLTIGLNAFWETVSSKL